MWWQCHFCFRSNSLAVALSTACFFHFEHNVVYCDSYIYMYEYNIYVRSSVHTIISRGVCSLNGKYRGPEFLNVVRAVDDMVDDVHACMPADNVADDVELIKCFKSLMSSTLCLPCCPQWDTSA